MSQRDDQQRSATVLDGLVALVVDGVLDGLRAPVLVEPPAWRLLTLAEAASRLGRSERWVRDRIKAGELPYVRLDGGAFAFELDDLQTFARVRRIGAEGLESLAERLQVPLHPAPGAALLARRLGDSQKVEKAAGALTVFSASPHRLHTGSHEQLRCPDMQTEIAGQPELPKSRTKKVRDIGRHCPSVESSSGLAAL